MKEAFVLFRRLRKKKNRKLHKSTGVRHGASVTENVLTFEQRHVLKHQNGDDEMAASGALGD